MGKTHSIRHAQKTSIEAARNSKMALSLLHLPSLAVLSPPLHSTRFIPSLESFVDIRRCGMADSRSVRGFEWFVSRNGGGKVGS